MNDDDDDQRWSNFILLNVWATDEEMGDCVVGAAIVIIVFIVGFFCFRMACLDDNSKCPTQSTNMNVTIQVGNVDTQVQLEK